VDYTLFVNGMQQQRLQLGSPAKCHITLLAYLAVPIPPDSGNCHITNPCIWSWYWDNCVRQTRS